VLPTGRWPYTVVLRDAASGLTTTVTRSVRVR
jgi:hypothetical protein